MKKIITTLLFLLLVFGLFAETGYNGTEWGTKRERLDFGENVDEWIFDKLDIIAFRTVTLGEDSIKSYIFDEKKGLDCVSYVISEKTVPELISKFENKNKVYEIQTQLFTSLELYDVLDEVIKEGQTPEFYDGSNAAVFGMVELIAELNLYEFAFINEKKGYKNIPKAKKKKAGVGKLYIYDYNDNTRVFIASGNVEGKAYVAYIPHYKDY